MITNFKIITIKNTVIQFTGDGDNPVKSANEMIQNINYVLQSKFPFMQPQIMKTEIDTDDVEVEINE